MTEDPYQYNAQGAPATTTSNFKKPYNPLNRPEIHFGRFTAALLIYAGLLTALILLLHHFAVPHILLICLGFTFVYGCVIGRRAVIWLVHVYQRLAPDHVRLRCVFTPSCSEYMIASVQKYGLFRGVWRGICRLHRCHYPNCGEDLP